MIKIFRLFLFVTLIVLGAAINIKILKAYKINYPYIFAIRPKKNQSSTKVLICGLIMALFFSICLLAQLNFFQVYPQQNRAPTVILSLGFVFGIMFCPFDILNRPARIEICKIIFDCIFAPFRPVYFRTFFTADVITSSKIMLRDMTAMFCFYSSCEFVSDVPLECWWVVYVDYSWEILPPWFRFWQCIRRCYNDPTLIN